ncbi:glycosyltransferase family 4 protein [Epilithonimonas arachidiradicis]|uniref:Glycosyltransferase involved in cell wall biosynthesis n=1 Tax=Epilithonimonas arachidiradicis TaxID=1617282 RepID=A0A420D7Z5_9FLAO|nr:glycosyltransferase family 4 protein [Epilithonimonas arachidiradicis]RKE86828.1 glycosyltransferase involved in cell wall biosynthesis [Epilithonimonas arachidiradicis]GGG61697.1 hypothetical protein GCM10007332_24560 [Epilithonimonas arachidiradicis]
MKSTKISYLFEFPKFKKLIKNINDIVFFFPVYHFGGGERVHADILSVFAKYKTTCIIVYRSENDFMKEDFLKNTSQLIDIGHFRSLKYQNYYKLLAKKINIKKKPIVFGCNNLFFYKLIPYLESHVKIIDLTHAFTYEDPYSPEKFSINIAHRIHKRIILGKKTYEDYKLLYENANIEADLLKRIEIIHNKVDLPDSLPPKQKNKKLKIIFVSRNSHEKRPEIFFEIAQRCFDRSIPVEFLLIGDFDKNIKHTENMIIIGSIKEKDMLNFYYQQSDLILITSYREGFPMVLLEAMAYGTVPISTDVGEISEFIGEEFGNGVIIQDRSIKNYIKKNRIITNEKWIPKNLLKNIPIDVDECIESFIKTIIYFDENRDKLYEMSRNSYETTANNFSTESNKKAYLKVFFEE